ncbi:hypothetical protein T11_641 [Trichinella zimbabwensis]|uniref:Uncharacterized protein n=1 Tax=Trichinella zimbabwensis TaxID=268475 RepID=A0A0V1G9D1_9BILA|nr:hypothetical protein T11_641 [Trichinella zimbabwensis]
MRIAYIKSKVELHFSRATLLLHLFSNDNNP